MRYDEAMIEFYNAFACTPVERFDQIPERAISMLSKLEKYTIVEASVKTDLEKGLSERKVASRYNIGRQRIRGIKKKYLLG